MYINLFWKTVLLSNLERHETTNCILKIVFIEFYELYIFKWHTSLPLVDPSEYGWCIRRKMWLNPWQTHLSTSKVEQEIFFLKIWEKSL